MTSKRIVESLLDGHDDVDPKAYAHASLDPVSYLLQDGFKPAIGYAKTYEKLLPLKVESRNHAPNAHVALVVTDNDLDWYLQIRYRVCRVYGVTVKYTTYPTWFNHFYGDPADRVRFLQTALPAVYRVAALPFSTETHASVALENTTNRIQSKFG